MDKYQASSVLQRVLDHASFYRTAIELTPFKSKCPDGEEIRQAIKCVVKEE